MVSSTRTCRVKAHEGSYVNGNTVIIQGVDGVDIWYGNLTNVSVKLYDYVEKDKLIGVSFEKEMVMTFLGPELESEQTKESSGEK